MAFIQVNEDWAIKSDQMQWMVCRKKEWSNKETGEDVIKWNPVTYHIRLEEAVKSLADRLLRLDDSTNVSRLALAASDIAELLDKRFADIIVRSGHIVAKVEE